MKKILFLVLITIFVVSIGYSDITCNVEHANTCNPGEDLILRLTRPSHTYYLVRDISDTTAPDVLCCKSTLGTISSREISKSDNCNSDELDFVWLSNDISNQRTIYLNNNPSAEKKICLGVDKGTIICNIDTSCNPNWDTLFKLEKTPADSQQYWFIESSSTIPGLMSMCCIHSLSGNLPSVTYQRENIISGESYEVYVGEERYIPVEINNPSERNRVVDIYLYSDNSDFNEWIWIEGHRYDSNSKHITLSLGPHEKRQVLVSVLALKEGIYNLYILKKDPSSGNILNDPNNIFDHKIILASKKQSQGFNSEAPGMNIYSIISTILIGSILLSKI